MNKLTKITLFILAFLVFLILVISLYATSKKDSYDISMMKEVEVEDILDMFQSGKTYVLLVGSSDCDVCAGLIPSMAEAQKEHNYITQYLDIMKVDFSSSAWQELVKKLDMKSEQTLSDDAKGEKITETYGYFLDNYAMAPTVIIIKGGKQTGGFIGGGVDEQDLIDWLGVKIKDDEKSAND